MYGNKTISLPNLEQLTKDGIIYTNTYAPVPVCAPKVLITGMYPGTIELIICEHAMLTKNLLTFY